MLSRKTPRPLRRKAAEPAVTVELPEDMVRSIDRLAPQPSVIGGLDVPEARRRNALEDENARLKKLLAEAISLNERTKMTPAHCDYGASFSFDASLL